MLGGCFASGNFIEDSPEQDDSEEQSEALEATQTVIPSSMSGKKASRRAKNLLKKREEIEEIEIPEINIEAGDQDESVLDI